MQRADQALLVGDRLLKAGGLLPQAGLRLGGRPQLLAQALALQAPGALPLRQGPELALQAALLVLRVAQEAPRLRHALVPLRLDGGQVVFLEGLASRFGRLRLRRLIRDLVEQLFTLLRDGTQPRCDFSQPRLLLLQGKAGLFVLDP